MRLAAVHVRIDPEGSLSLDQVMAAVEDLRGRDVPVIASDLERVAPARRRIELLLYGDDGAALRERAEALCRAALADVGEADGAPEAVAVTYTSSGADADALGIMRGFGVTGPVRIATVDDEDLAVLIVDQAALEGLRVSRLQTALESGLNREVELVTDWEGPSRSL